MTLNATKFMPIAVSVAIAVFFLVGCHEPEDVNQEQDETMVSRGIITASMNRYLEVGADSPIEQFAIMGMFARFDAETTVTVDSLLGDFNDDEDLAIDSCTSPELVLSEASRTYPSTEAAIELLDVGNLTLTFDEIKKTIPTRTFPDLLKVVVGVIYVADETKGVFFRPGAQYDVRAFGSDLVEPFNVALQAPEDLGDISVNGTVAGEQIPVIGRRENVELSWQGDGNGDEVIATLSWMSMGSPWSMACRMRDDGTFVIPAEITASLPDPLTCSDQELVMSRVRRMAFTSQGLSSGFFKFVVSTSFSVSF